MSAVGQYPVQCGVLDEADGVIVGREQADRYVLALVIVIEQSAVCRRGRKLAEQLHIIGYRFVIKLTVFGSAWQSHHEVDTHESQSSECAVVSEPGRQLAKRSAPDGVGQYGIADVPECGQQSDHG